MKRILIIFLIFLSLSFAENTFGSSNVTMTKTWIIHCPRGGCTAEFDGLLVVNNSNQRVLSIVTEPEMELAADENNEIHVIYNGLIEGDSLTLEATVDVELDYNTELTEDPPLDRTEINSTELTEPDEKIMEQAEKLEDPDSTLNTIRNVADWVNSNIEYDISYFGQNRDAKTVFIEKKGVCVEYSHLTISMLNHLGMETRYVNGYVISDDWQPHAWVEVYIPGGGWLPVDSTFGQIGILDSSHLMVSYGLDQKTDFDSLTSNQLDTILDRRPTELTLTDMAEDAKGLSVDIGFENKTYRANTNAGNSRGEYVYGIYSFYPPAGYGEVQREILLLSPYEIREMAYQFDGSLFKEGYSYTLPLRAEINDAEDAKLVVLVKPKKTEAVEPGEICPAASALILLTVFSLRMRTSNHS